jgi:hypothetical protein
MVENESRFSLAEETPPLQEPIISEIGFLAESEEVERILDGSYVPPPGTDPFMVKLLKELRMPEATRRAAKMPATISEEDNRATWSRQRESTSASHLGLSFSHYKAATWDDPLNKFDTESRMIPYVTGMTPESWRNITDVEILKKPGVFDIEKMRTITLMDAAFNMNNKQLGRDLLANAEKNGTLAREQYGSRKGLQAATAALNKRLTFDLWKTRRSAGSIASTDAQSAYDRVAHNIASIAMRQQGAPKAPVISMFRTLQKANHFISTAYGYASESYGGDRHPPLQGMGQGNGAGPTIWAVLSTPVMNLVRRAGFGFSMLTAISVSLVSFICYAFVDDNDLVHSSGLLATTGEENATEMQGAVDQWGGGLRATGGALRADKSYWYLVDFEYRNGNWKFRTKNEMEGEVWIDDISGERRRLKRKEFNEAEKSLGILQTADGNWDSEVEMLLQKVFRIC